MLGIFTCPMPTCQIPIIGSYTDLLAHVRSHPGSEAIVDEETGKSIVEMVEEAREEAFKKKIVDVLVVDESPDGEQHGGVNG